MMYRKQIIVGYHPGHVIVAAERYRRRMQEGQALAGPNSQPGAGEDLNLILDYRNCNPFLEPVPPYLRDISLYKWVLYLLASEYAANALDLTSAFPNGLQ